MGHTWRLCWCALAVALSPGRAAAAPADEPVLVLRFSSWDDLLGAVRHVATSVGRPDAAQKVDGLVKMATGERGLAGLDTTKPLGLAGFVRANGELDWLCFVPVKDARAFEELVRLVAPNAAADKDGLLVVPTPLGVAFARSQRGYFFVGRQRAAVLQAAVPSSSGSSRDVVRLDLSFLRLDEAARRAIEQRVLGLVHGAMGPRMAPSAAEMVLGRRPGEEQAIAAIGELLRDAERLSFGLQVKPGAAEIVLETDLVARPKSELLGRIDALGKSPSSFGTLFDRDAAVSFVGVGVMPREHWEQLSAIIGNDLAAAPAANESQALLEAANGVSQASPLEWMERVRRIFFPGDLIDLTVHVDGVAWNQLQLAVGVKVSSAQDFEKLVEDIAKMYKPGDDVGPIERGIGQHRGARFHRISNLGPLAAVFGRDPLHIAVAESRVLFCLGPGSLARTRALVDRLGQAASRPPPVQLSIRPSRLLGLLAGKEPSLATARDAARGRGDYVLFETLPLERGARSRLTLGESLLRIIGAQMGAPRPARSPAAR